MDSGDEEGMRPTISSQAGFYAANRPSTRVSSPFLVQRVADSKCLASLRMSKSTDRAVYITPDAVSGDQNLYARQYREEIVPHWAALTSWVLRLVLRLMKSSLSMAVLPLLQHVGAVVF